jgi:hypothetical protein
MLVFLKSFGCFVLLAMLFPSVAYAYLDPGTMSMVLQALAAGAITILVFWSRFKAKIRSIFSAKNEVGRDEDRVEHEEEKQ